MESAIRRRNIKDTINKKEIGKNTQPTKKNNSKNQNVKIDFKYIIKDYFKFYKQKLMRKHIIVYIVCLIVFFAMIAMLIAKINSTPNIAELTESAKKISEQSNNVFSLIISKKIPLLFMVIFAGISPYFYLPVIGICYSYSLAADIVTNFNVLTGKVSLIPMCIGAIIELIAISLAVATGIEYCILSTKKWKYSRNQDYSMLDFKKTFYEATSNKNKLEKINRKKEEKRARNEKNNVKVPYLHLLVSFVISIIIIVIGTIIAKV